MANMDHGPKNIPAKLTVPEPLKAGKQEQERVANPAVTAELSRYVESTKKEGYPSYIGDNKHSGPSGAPLVRALTTALHELGYYPDGPTDNYHGRREAIEKAVTAFQKKNGLKPDGCAGAKTVTALIKAYSTDKE